MHKKHEKLYEDKYILGNKYMKDGSEYMKNVIDSKNRKRKVKTNPS